MARRLLSLIALAHAFDTDEPWWSDARWDAAEYGPGVPGGVVNFSNARE